jgi:DNA-directed RNA polymerase subunit RPC12/RpoP
MAIVSTVIGRRRRCPACGKEQVVDRLSKDGNYHCKKCGHRIAKKDLSAKPHPRH